MATSVTVRADSENNAEAFWDSLRAVVAVMEQGELRSKCLLLMANGWVDLTDAPIIEQFDALVHSLAGFADGPEHAREALIFQAN